MILTRKKTYTLLMVLLPLIVALAAFQVGVTYAQGDDPPADDDESGDRQNPLCTDPEAKPHPVLAGIAERYSVDYQQLVDWKCEENFGVGQILVALQTSGLIDEDAHALLGKNGKGNAWGKIWKEAGLIGSESDGGPPPWAQNNKNKDKNGNGPPDHANGNGKPENPGQQGQHDDDDDDDGPGQGQNGNGPPDHANNDKDKPENEDKGDDDDDDDAQALTCESGLVLDGDTVEDAEKLSEKYDVPKFEIIAQLCGGASLNEVESGLEGDD